MARLAADGRYKESRDAASLKRRPSGNTRPLSCRAKRTEVHRMLMRYLSEALSVYLREVERCKADALRYKDRESVERMWKAQGRVEQAESMRLWLVANLSS